MTALQDLQQTISHFVDGMRKRRQLQSEIEQLEAMGSLDAVLADAGLVRSQIGPLIAGCADSRELLDEMLARLGIDAGKMPVESVREMAWTCTTCPDKRQCREWLSGTEETGFRTFCPNAAQLDHALSEQGLPRRLPADDEPHDGAFYPSFDELRRMRAEASRREVRALLDMAP